MADRPDRTPLWKALAAVQEQMPSMATDAEADAGPYKYRYVTLDAIMEKLQPLLTAQGLVWTTFPGFIRLVAGGRATIEPNLTYRLIHTESGEEQRGTFPLFMGQAPTRNEPEPPARRDAQAHGSALTYARRYATCAVFNITTGDDDDGAQATPRVSAAAAQATERAASAKQRGLINGKAAEKGLPASRLAALLSEVAGDEPREFQSEDNAGAWLQRQMDRLPARLVDPMLAAIERAE